MSFQRTLIIIKPDAVARGLAGRIVSRLEDKGLQIIGMKLMQVSAALARKHYREHKGKPFYDGLLRFITSGPALAMVVEGKSAIAVCRKLMGATFGADAEAGTIRGDFGISNRFNLIHGSDSPASARREIRLYFRPSELVRRPAGALRWIYDTSGSEPI